MHGTESSFVHTAPAWKLGLMDTIQGLSRLDCKAYVDRDCADVLKGTRAGFGSGGKRGISFPRVALLQKPSTHAVLERPRGVPYAAYSDMRPGGPCVWDSQGRVKRESGGRGQRQKRSGYTVDKPLFVHCCHKETKSFGRYSTVRARARLFKSQDNES